MFNLEKEANGNLTSVVLNEKDVDVYLEEVKEIKVVDDVTIRRVKIIEDYVEDKMNCKNREEF